MSRKVPQSINRVGGIQLFKLMQYTQANYLQDRLLDQQFAEKAAIDLGFPVTKGNIQGCREAFGIEATFLAERRESREPGTRLDRVEARLSALEAFARSLAPGFGKP